jgi:hypothetical protein
MSTKVIIIDDFLPQEDFEKLRDRARLQSAAIGVERNFFDHDPTPQIAELLKEFDKHREYDELAKFIHTAATPANFQHPIHYEAEFKIMTAILYLDPEESYGTNFLLDDYKEELEWKPNRLMCFCGETDVTWHDYRSGDAVRHTYNYFLVDPTKIENESYKNVCIGM